MFGYPDAGPESRLWIALDGVSGALEDLDPTLIGIALVGFAGDPRGVNQAAWVEAGLTNDFAAIAAAAARMRARGAAGSGCHSCAMRFGSELLASSVEKHRCPVLLVLTDGEPTLPYGPGYMLENHRAFARAINESGIRTRVLVLIGPDAEQEDLLKSYVISPGASREHADSSGDVASAINGAIASCGT